jgi:epidermal growth factor receptor substrate 15
MEMKILAEVLKQVWDLSDQDGDSMLSVREFCVSLYLMERFREGRPLPPVLPPGIFADDNQAGAVPRVDQGLNGPNNQQRYNAPTWQPNAGAI